MTNKESSKELKCAISDDEHCTIDPIQLESCCHLICKKCIPKDNVKEVKCKICGLISEQDFEKVI